MTLPARISPLLLILLLPIFQLLPVTASAALERSASYSARVEAGKWSNIRLRNLAKGVSLELGVSSTGPVDVLLTPAGTASRSTDIRHPLFRGKSANRLHFSVVIPTSGHYYLVIDNRTGTTAREFTVDLKVKANNRTAQTQTLTLINAKLALFVKVFKQVFNFESLSVRTAFCGDKTDFNHTGAVLICAEDAGLFGTALGSKDLAKKALMFRMMRGMARVLLEEWGYPAGGPFDVPGDGNRDAALADEFAAVLTVILGQEESAIAQARAIVNRAAADASIPGPGSRLLSVADARRVLGWLEDPNRLALKWEGFMIPHMKTRFLHGLRQRPKPWISPESVNRELNYRRARKLEV